MKLPKICPNCGVDLENDASCYALGIQYCNGQVLSIEKESDMLDRKDTEPMLELDLDHSGNSYWTDPYEVQCGECEYVLWSKFIIVNEEKFFVEGKT